MGKVDVNLREGAHRYQRLVNRNEDGEAYSLLMGLVGKYNPDFLLMYIDQPTLIKHHTILVNSGNRDKANRLCEMFPEIEIEATVKSDLFRGYMSPLRKE